jgi:hypothetical protein
MPSLVLPGEDQLEEDTFELSPDGGIYRRGRREVKRFCCWIIDRWSIIIKAGGE